MIAYASRTGTRSTLAVLRALDWRLLVTSYGELRTEGFKYGLDNSAWSAHVRGEVLDESRFARALGMLGRDADFVVMPDIVDGGEASLELTFRWMQRVLGSTERGLIAVQDGHEPWQVDELLGHRVGVFVGGTTAWKIANTPRWAAVARARGAWCHVGRVNTARRVALAGASGATSFDGSGPVRFPSTIPRLQRAVVRANNQTCVPLASGEVTDDERPWFEGPC